MNDEQFRTFIRLHSINTWATVASAFLAGTALAIALVALLA